MVLTVAGVLATLLMPGGYLEMRRTQRELEAQRAKVEALRKKNEEHTQTIRGLRSDPQAIERHARDLRYAKKGEIIQQLPEKPPAEKR